MAMRKYPRQRRVKVVERKLWREKCVGTADKSEFTIEIDPRQKSKAYLDTLIHEMLHLYNPDWSEGKVAEVATEMTRVVWSMNFRRIKN